MAWKEKEEESRDETQSKRKRPQFFRVLIPTPFVNLRIPRKFRKLIDGEKHKKATLFGPRGKFWHIDLTRDGDDLYFSGSWPEFAAAHELRTGYFLVFRYEGNMVFSVKVFDQSCCLKEYSQDDTRSSLDSSSKKRKRVDRENVEKERLNSRISVPKREIEDDEYSDLTIFPKFEKIVRPYNFLCKGMNIPKAFCLKNGLTSRRIVTLKDSKGRKFSMIFFLKINEGRLGKGWRVFAKENCLKEGDRCVFCLIDKDTLHVNVEQGSERPNSSKLIPKKENLHCVDDLTLFPQFEKIVKRFHLTYKYMPIARGFCIRNGLVSKCNMIVKDSAGRSWPFIFSFNSGEGRLCKGWDDFYKDNELKEGDKCIFQLVDKHTLLVQVVRE